MEPGLESCAWPISGKRPLWNAPIAAARCKADKLPPLPTDAPRARRCLLSRTKEKQGEQTSELLCYECTHPSRNVARTPPRAYLGPNARRELVGERLALEQLHEEHNALIGTARNALPDGETVRDGVRGVRRTGGEALLEHVVDFGRPETYAAGVPVGVCEMARVGGTARGERIGKRERYAR